MRGLSASTLRGGDRVCAALADENDPPSLTETTAGVIVCGRERARRSSSTVNRPIKIVRAIDL
jgi:hypothetical protein